jgi:phosphoribosyl 1,2-cyclic phosphodiesterase
MSIEVCVLASGSGGNCTVLRAPGGVVLVDAGLGPRMAARRMMNTGVRLSDVAAICLTHLDGDHFNSNWISTIVRRGISVYCHARRVDALLRRGGDPDLARFVIPFGNQAFEPVAGLAVQPIAFAHDQAGSHGFVVEGFGSRIGYASDLGHVPDSLVEHFCDLDVLAIESNYDPRMQIESGRPEFLKRRIMGGAGHLSNQQALSAVKRILDRCQDEGRRLPAHIVLLHRSRQCNCPQLLRRLFARDARIAPRLTLAEQYSASPWLRCCRQAPLRGEQLMLAWG